MIPAQGGAATRQPVVAKICALMQAHRPWRYTGPIDNLVKSMTEPRDSVDPPADFKVTQNVTGLTWRATDFLCARGRFGRQSAHKQERDFATGSTRRFIVTGVILSTLFISALISVVRLSPSRSNRPFSLGRGHRVARATICSSQRPPLLRMPTLDRQLDAEIFLKAESATHRI